MTTTQLTTNEQALLAREVAADRRIGGGGWYNDNMREVFNAGWDAALAWVEEQRHRNTCDYRTEYHRKEHR